jgi:hypothetical protein
MDLDDALSAVEHLPSRYRLLLGRGHRNKLGEGVDDDEPREPLEINWQAGDIRDVGKLRGIEYMSEIGEPLVKLYERYRAGVTRVMLSVDMSDSTVTFIVLGAESVGQVAEALRTGAEELISWNVRNYLAGHFLDWKQPAAKVLPFPSRGRKPDSGDPAA